MLLLDNEYTLKVDVTRSSRKQAGLKLQTEVVTLVVVSMQT
tara:strand:+ start:358 stop:480 length:123 start_codon:yes stop_codon:yes gene_type:complete